MRCERKRSNESEKTLAYRSTPPNSSFWMIFSSIDFASFYFYSFSLISGTPDHVKNDFNVILFAKSTKSQVLKDLTFAIDFGHGFGIILNAFSHKIPWLFDIGLCIHLLMDF